mmetsp:Transcript_34764/g.84040  ORF Transcript_34764/g.84040 Transcript_34764/m.84040 type:complete len:217 (+) Transcript_34764:44-694(+)
MRAAVPILALAAASSDYCVQGDCPCGQCAQDGGCVDKTYDVPLSQATSGTCRFFGCTGRGDNITCTQDKTCVCDEGFFGDWSFRSYCRPLSQKSCWAPGGSCYAVTNKFIKCAAKCEYYDFAADATSNDWVDKACPQCLNLFGLHKEMDQCTKCLNTCDAGAAAPAEPSQAALAVEAVADSTPMWAGAAGLAAVVGLTALRLRQERVQVDHSPLLA